jgi:hypothetical protein
MKNLLTYVKNQTQPFEGHEKNLEKYFVSMNSRRFSEDDLKIHMESFNPIIHPEYYSYERLGLDYVNTVLMPKDVLDKNIESGQRQKYRYGVNKSYEKIRRDIVDKGINLRNKMIFIAIDREGNFIDLFSGNTFNSILESSNLENRIVSIFRTNDKFSNSNLIKIGVHQNTLINPSGEATPTDIKFALTEIVQTGELGTLEKNANSKQRSRYAGQLIDAITDMVGEKRSYVTKRKQLMKIVSDVMDEQLADKAIFSVKHGVDLMNFLRENSNQYDNSRLMYYTSFSNSHPSKAIQSMAGDWSNFKDSVRNNPHSSDYFNYERGTYCVILHGGTINPENPIADFFTKNMSFMDQWNKNMNFITSDLLSSDKELKQNPRIMIYGMFQPLKDLDHILPYLSVVTVEEFVDAYENYFLKGNLMNNKSVKSSNIVENLTDDDIDEYTEDAEELMAA